MDLIRALGATHKLLTTGEVAERLGLSAKTIHRYIRAGRLPVVRLGTRSVRIDPASLAEWITTQQFGGSTAKSDFQPLSGGIAR